MPKSQPKEVKGIKNIQAFSGVEVRTKIVDALNSKRYKARTVAGIAKVAHVPVDQVLSTIKGDPSLREMIKVYPRRSAKGELLLTTKEKFYEDAGFTDKFADVFATKRWSLDDV